MGKRTGKRYRQCLEKVASLQAVLRLSDADRNRLLEAAAVSAPIRFTVSGHTNREPVHALAINPVCLAVRIEVENTGVQTVETNGAELLLPPGYAGNPEGGEGAIIVDTESGPRARHWVEAMKPLALGQKFYDTVQFCKQSHDPKRHGQLLNGTLVEGAHVPLIVKYYSRNFLPAASSFMVVEHVYDTSPK